MWFTCGRMLLCRFRQRLRKIAIYRTIECMEEFQVNRVLGFFSGFPSRSFPSNIAERLREELVERNSLIFVSAWPSEHARNDEDATGMHGMFEEIGLPFGRYDVIDDRASPSQAIQLIQEASCVWLMGGHPGLQLELICEKGLKTAIRNTSGMLLGVSAGAINMAVRSLDTKESLEPYEGLGLADITIKPHFSPQDKKLVDTLVCISKNLPISAMEDNSAIFVSDNRVSVYGAVHWIHQGKINSVEEGEPLPKGT